MFAAGLLACAVAVPPAGCGDRYFLTLFGAQSVPLRAAQTHTFGVISRVTTNPDGSFAVQSDTISWMPATLTIRPHALRPEPGVNLTMGETFAWVGSFGGRVSVWGPYEIGPDHYFPKLARKAELESGAISYRAIGGILRNAPVSNCGQSFTRPAPSVGRRFQPTPSPGENGTSVLAARYERAGAFLDPDTRHLWLLPYLGAEYPVTPREPGERVRRR